MSPKLMLWGCYAFVFWALRRDTRQHPHPGTLWLPTIWMMRCASRTIDVWIGGGENGRWEPVFIAVMVFGGLFALSRRACRWGEIFSRNSAVFVFYGYLILSLSWADGLESPLIKIFRPVGDLVMALLVVTEPNPRAAILTMFRRTALALIPLSIVLIRYYPYLGRTQNKHWGADDWVGVSTHKNPLGQLCLVSTLACVWALDDARELGRSLWRERVAWFYLAMTLHLFDAGGHSRSSTAILCCGFALALFYIFGRMRDRPEVVSQRIVFGIVTLIVVSFVLEIFGTSLQEVTSSLQGKNADLTGRTWLWSDVVRISMAEHPLLGSGYGAFWIPSLYPKLSPAVDNRPAESHNGYLETFANLGLVGVVLLAWIIIQTLKSSTRTVHADFPYGRLRLVLFFTVLLMNYSEATFPRGTHLWWFGFLVIAVSAPTARAVRLPGMPVVPIWRDHNAEEKEESGRPAESETVPRW